MWLLPGGIEQRVPCLPRWYFLTQRPERCLIGQDAPSPLVVVHNGRFVCTNYGHHVTRGAITMDLAKKSGYVAMSPLMTERFMSHPWMRCPSVKS